MIAALTIIGVIGYACGVASDIYLRFLEADDMISAKHQHQNNLDNLKDEIKRSNLDVDKTGDIIELYQLLLKQQVSPLNFIARLQTVIKSPIIVKNVDWITEDKGPNGVVYPKPKTTATLQLQFPAIKDLDEWRVVSKQIQADLKVVFKEYDISYAKLPQRFTEGGDKLDINFDANSTAPKPPPTKDSSDVTMIIKEL